MYPQRNKKKKKGDIWQEGEREGGGAFHTGRTRAFIRRQRGERRPHCCSGLRVLGIAKVGHAVETLEDWVELHNLGREIRASLQILSRVTQ